MKKSQHRYKHNDVIISTVNEGRGILLCFFTLSIGFALELNDMVTALKL